MWDSTGLDPYLWVVAASQRQTKNFLYESRRFIFFFVIFFLPVFQVAQVCCNCGVCMGEYFCRTCKFFDDDVRSFFSDATIGRLFRLIIWLVVDGMMLFCRLTRSTTIAKTAASAGASPVST